MKEIIILIVSLLVVSCSNDINEKKYTKLTCKSGIVTPWVELFTFRIHSGGHLTYNKDGSQVHDHIKKGDKCVQLYKKSIPGTKNEH